MRFADSAGDFNLQIADFIVGAFLKSLQEGSYAKSYTKFEGLHLRIVNDIL